MSRDGISQDVYGGAAYDSWAETDVGQSYIDSGAFDDYDDSDSGDDYTPTDPQGKDNYYAKSEAHGNMSKADQETLASYGAAWNAANDAYQKAVAEGRDDDAANYKSQMDKAHADAEALRESYGYRGGEDGSEYNVFEVPKQQAPVKAPVQQFTAQVPDFQSLLDSWLATAKKQQELGIDYATQKGVNDLQRAEEDAQEQFQTQQNQIDRNEAKALDNQALYAEARGDRGGIGEAQYAQIQATAMENRRAVNTARVKLSTDTKRQIDDLRAQGEFQKADALLQLTQTYLSQLVDLQKWGAEYTLDVAQFNAQLQQWQAEFEEDARRWQLEFDYTTSTKDQSMLAESGLAALAVGVRPSAAQQAAMGYTDAQIDAELAAFKLAQTAGVKIDSPAPKGDDDVAPPDIKTNPYEYLYYYGVDDVDTAAGMLSKQYGDYADVMAELYIDTKLPAFRRQEAQPSDVPTSEYGSKYSTVWGRARKMFDEGKTAEEIKKYLDQFSEDQLTDSGLIYILNNLGIYN